MLYKTEDRNVKLFRDTVFPNINRGTRKTTLKEMKQKLKKQDSSKEKLTFLPFI